MLLPLLPAWLLPVLWPFKSKKEVAHTDQFYPNGLRAVSLACLGWVDGWMCQAGWSGQVTGSLPVTGGLEDGL